MHRERLQGKLLPYMLRSYDKESSRLWEQDFAFIMRLCPHGKSSAK